MLLLMLLLAAEDEHRVLIDALLHVTPHSRAAVCRAAGVQPAALSRFLQPTSRGQIAEAGQLSLLDVLGWPNGGLAPQRAHVWRVRSLDAAEWLLKVKLKAKAQLAAVAGADGSGASLLIGTHGEDSPLILQAWASVRDLSPLLSDSVSKKWGRSRIREIPDWAAKALRAPTVTPEEFRAAVAGDKQAPSGWQQIQDLANQLGPIGLSGNVHVNLLLDWLTVQCNKRPNEVVTVLDRLDQLALPEGRIALSSLTRAQKLRLVERLARRPLAVLTLRDLGTGG
ncbi:hypothetical protein RAMLITH_24165 [Ramlibacter sp. RBP-2]|uniref:Uncharacterized protein n=1 Tax=Ramlibacter lithotrophicus TaxID=2606681 RepID=A0A7X6DKL1_9BURK|nr:hypothetical protein [Ramlibacter lithotrophicus]NKE68911.1 hypothetical protein [Ramlibacter lithotrophicus]